MATLKEKEKWPFAKRIGQVRISSQELISLLERWAGDGTVTAASKRHQFSSLEDIKDNISIFSGKLEIRITAPTGFAQSIDVSLEDCAKVGSHSNDPDIALQVEKIIRDLKVYRVPLLGYLTIIPGFLWAFAFTLLVWLIPGPEDIESFSLFGLSKQNTIPLWLGAICLSILGFIMSTIPQVFYNPRETFWQRVKDQIALVVITLIIGAGFTELVRWILNWNSP
ncbi:hypothetical protein [Ascidiaceihabitans sp.]|uniref:hypothetical protein n=1 Tax=Ascidiaceihabitans sp. TaxID=1872644 RepID=UPI0032980432